MNEIILIESKSARDNYIDKIDILSVFGLDMRRDYFLLKDVANFFCCPEGTIKSVISRSREEFEQDGLKMFTYAEAKENYQKLQIETSEINPRGMLGFNIRCILRTAMLLEKNEKARAIRTALLDNVEKQVGASLDSLSDNVIFAKAVLIAQNTIHQLEDKTKKQEKQIRTMQCRTDVEIITRERIRACAELVRAHYNFAHHGSAHNVIYEKFLHRKGFNLKKRYKEAKEYKKSLPLWKYLIDNGLAYDYLQVVAGLLANDSRGSRTDYFDKQDILF